MVELWTDTSLPSATVGSNLHQVWCIHHSVEETLCHNSNCRTPGLRAYNLLNVKYSHEITIVIVYKCIVMKFCIR